jgi:hypothetical protein
MHFVDLERPHNKTFLYVPLATSYDYLSVGRVPRPTRKIAFPWSLPPTAGGLLHLFPLFNIKLMSWQVWLFLMDLQVC